MPIARVLCIKIPILTGILLLSNSGAYACDCTKASLYGDQINVYLSPNAKTQVTVNDTVELPQIGDQMTPNAAQHRFNLDIQQSSILIDFNHGFDDELLSYDADTAFYFDDINPQLPNSDCITKLAGMYIQSNNPEATWLNAQSTFSVDKVKVAFGGDTLQGNSNRSSNWSKHHWIKVNLSFSCSAPPPAPARKGMTWGFRGQTIPDGPAELVQVGCNSVTEWATGQGGMCDPYKGETSCAAERHILCVEEAGDIPRPAYAVKPGKANFTGWYPGLIKLSPKIRGEQLTSIAAANDFCGDGWRIAEFHDGHWIEGMDADNHHEHSNPPWNLADAKTKGGWNFHAQFSGSEDELNRLKTERLWVHINGQEANCWNF